MQIHVQYKLLLVTLAQYTKQTDSVQCEALDTLSMLIPETAFELHVQSCAELFTGNSLLWCPGIGRRRGTGTSFGRPASQQTRQITCANDGNDHKV